MTASNSETNHVALQLEPLTPTSFAPFGTVIDPRELLSPLSGSKDSQSTSSTSTPVSANQGTALKFPRAADLTDYYEAWQAPSHAPAGGSISVFICRARQLHDVNDDRGTKVLDVPVLERHPYTAQTFVTLGLAAGSTNYGPDGRRYIVVVAPTLNGSGKRTSGGRGSAGGPDLTRARAFIARGDQAVTYAAGTWHAPMIVVDLSGKADASATWSDAVAVPFVVVQMANGVSREDCEEVELEKEGTLRLTVVFERSLFNNEASAKL